MTNLQINLIKIHQKEFRTHFGFKVSTYHKNFRKLKNGQPSRFDSPAVLEWINKKMEE